MRLYVRRVLVTDNAEGLLPSYLRFLRGVVDTEDIALNVSREMLQHDPVLTRIGSAVVTKVLSELEKKAEKDAEAYAKFWETFGAVLKEGIYEDIGRREQLLKLARFRSVAPKAGVPRSAGDKLTSLAEYVGRLKDKQDAIDAGELAVLPALLKQGLGARVKDVRVSDRLTDSAVCLVADEHDMPRHLAGLLKAQGQLNDGVASILEINPQRALIRTLVAVAKNPAQRAHVDDVGRLLLDQAMIREGDAPADPADFARRLSDVMTRALGAK